MLPRRLRPAKKGCGFANYLVYEQFNLPASTSGLDSSSVRALASDDNGVWIIAFGSPRAVYFRSEDNGDTWVELSINDAPNFAPPMYTGNSVYERFGIVADSKGHWKSFGSDRKLYASDDDGKTWATETNLGSFFPLASGDEFINTILRTDNNGVWFAIGTINHTPFHSDTTLRSLDNGDNWELYEGKYPERFTESSICSDKNGNWYGCAGSSFTNVNMCKSTDNGETWAESLVFPGDYIGEETNHQFGSMFASTTGTIVASFSGKYFRSPGDEWEPYFSREAMARSVDFGETWEVIYPDVGSTGIAIAGPGAVGMLSDNNSFWINNYGYLICSEDNGKTWFRGPDGMGIDASNTHPVAYGNNRFMCGRSYRNIDYENDNFLKRDSISKSKQFVAGYDSCHDQSTQAPVVPDIPVCDDTKLNKMVFDRFSMSADNETVYRIVYSGGTWIATLDDEIVLRSTNKGDTWAQVAVLPRSPRPEPISLETNGNNKWIIMSSRADYPHYVSEDDGLTWTQQTLSGLDYYSANDRLICDRRTDQPPTWIIWGTSNRYNYRSVDDGITWVKMAKPSTVSGTYGNFRSIAYAGTGKWAAVYESKTNDIYYSNDGALTFSRVYTIPNAPGGINMGKCMASNGKGTVIQTGYSIYGSAPIYRSTDYGQNWTKIEDGINSYGMYRYHDLLFNDGEEMWYSTGMFLNSAGSWADCVVTMSIDDGVTWQAGPIGFNLAGNNFSRKQINAVCGDYGDGRFIIGNNSKYYCSKSRI